MANPSQAKRTVSQAGAAGKITVASAALKTRPANTTAYASGQCVNESTTVGTAWSFPNSTRSIGTGRITAVTIADSAKQSTTPQFNLWLFTAAPTVQNDGAAFAPSFADLQNLIGVVSLSTFTVGNGNGILQSTGLNIPFQLGENNTTIYGVLVAANAYTPVSAEKFNITLMIDQD